MKTKRKQFIGRAFFRMMTMSIILCAGSASAATLDVAPQTLISPETLVKMNEAIGGIQKMMMVTISDAIRKSTSNSSDPAVVRTVREQKMKERVLYKKMHPIMMKKCTTITAPLNSAKNDIDEKKSVNSTVAINKNTF